MFIAHVTPNKNEIASNGIKRLYKMAILFSATNKKRNRPPVGGQFLLLKKFNSIIMLQSSLTLPVSFFLLH